MTQIVLVTGASGLVGQGLKNIVNKCYSQKDSNFQFIWLSSKEGDLRNYNECYEIFSKQHPSYVLHLAAYVGGLFKNLKYPVEFWHNNVAMNDNILKCSHLFKVKKVISCLSTCIFPDKTIYPIDETMIHNGPPHDSNEAYAYAKRMIDILNRSYNRQYGCCFTSIIPTNVYGPHDNFNLEDSHVIPGLIHKCYLAKKNNTDLTVFGTGKPLRQFIYSEDLAKLILWALENYEDVNPIILSVDEKDEVSISKVVDYIAVALNFKNKIFWDKTKSDGQFKKTASNVKLRSLNGNFVFKQIEEGIKETCNQFVENYDNARK